ncbi:response regulator FixJ [Zavarzinia sp. CC-PAN008]|uniref:response regulator FixJ n=1 Tax=Zavarzinia sp. CC-PAN008 TaxID=3243332 RepID=UPI003F74851F
MNEQPIVHVIDDDEAVRESLVFLLTSAAITAVPHPSGESFIGALPVIGQGCILTDVRMPGMTGIELLHRVQAHDRNLPVIVMTGHGDVPMAVEALKAGAFDFIEKPFSDEQIIATVQAALAARGRAQEERADRAAIQARLEALTTRERQVLDGLIAGHPNKTIAYDLGISPRTVEIYRANVMSKLNASSLSEVIRMTFVARGADPSLA